MHSERCLFIQNETESACHWEMIGVFVGAAAGSEVSFVDGCFGVLGALSGIPERLHCIMLHLMGSIPPQTATR